MNVYDVIPEGLSPVEGSEADAEIGTIQPGETASVQFELEKGVAQLGLQADMPEAVKNAFLNCYYSKIEEVLKTDFDSYENVKTAANLVNKVSKEIAVSDGRIEFDMAGVQYVCEYKSIGVWGGSYIQGTIKNTKTNREYIFGGTSVNNQEIQEEMNYLKQFADLKIEEAKKAVFSDAGNILEISKLKEFTTSMMKKKFYETIDNYIPNLSKKIQKLDGAADKFTDLKKAFDKVKKIDLSGTDVDDIAKKITDYSDSWQSWTDAVSGL